MSQSDGPLADRPLQGKWSSTSLFRPGMLRIRNGVEWVLMGRGIEDARPGAEQRTTGRRALLLPYVGAVVVVFFATLLGLPFRNRFDSDYLTMVYLTGAVFAAIRLGLGPAVLASVLSVVAFNFFFVAPYQTLIALDPHNYAVFAVLLVTSLLSGSLVAGLAKRFSEATRSQIETGLLLDLTRDLASARDQADIEGIATKHLGGSFAEEVSVRPGGEFSMPGVLHFPLGCDFGDLVLLHDPGRHYSAAEKVQLETAASIIASALQRTCQADEAARSRADTENEKLRNILLASLSHDLRTPLTVMNGDVAALLKQRRQLPRGAVDQITSLSRQVTRLQKFTGNLLKIAAISSGSLVLNREPYPPAEIVGAALTRLPAPLSRR